VWKYRQIMTADDHRAHPYVDIAHRAALLYSFATLLITAFVELSAWPAWVNLTAAGIVVFFFVSAIFSYVMHGAWRETVNQFENPDHGTAVGMGLLIAGEIGGFGVILAGFVVGQLL
jgi:membrane protein YdbS with pleckstrin-like domain